MGSDIIRTIQVNNYTNDLVVQFEVVLKLSSKPDLIGFYLCLLLLVQLKVVNLVNQDVLSDILGMSKPTFIKKKKGLMEFGLLEEESVGKQKKLILKVFPQLAYFQPPTTPVAVVKYVEKIRTEIGKFTTTKVEQVKKQPTKQRFPAKDYKTILAGFLKYKGVELRGAEKNIVYKAAKTMFQSGRTVKNILDLMKWISEHENQKGFKWLRNWTIWTVQKKMPEYVAGKFKNLSKLDLADLYEDIK